MSARTLLRKLKNKALHQKGLPISEAFQDKWRALNALGPAVEVVSGQPVVPGVTFWLDPEGEQRVTCGSARGGVRITADVQKRGRWLGMHFVLGECDLSDTGIMGYYAKSHAVRACSLRAALRCGKIQGDGFNDYFFDKHMVSYASALHTDVMELHKQSRFPQKETWREFVLFFHVESFELTLRDLRLFSA